MKADRSLARLRELWERWKARLVLTTPQRASTFAEQ